MELSVTMNPSSLRVMGHLHTVTDETLPDADRTAQIMLTYP